MTHPIDTMLRPGFPLPTMGYPPHPFMLPLYFHYPDPHNAPPQAPSYPNHIYGAYGQVFGPLRHHMAQQGFPAPFGHGRGDYPYAGWFATQDRYRVPQPTKSSQSLFDASSVAGGQEQQQSNVLPDSGSTLYGEPDAEMSDVEAGADDRESDKVSKSRLSKVLGRNDFKEITLILLRSPSRTLRLRQIYEALQERHACLRAGSNWWHGRVRYLLSVKKRFVLIDPEDDDNGDDESARGKWHVDLSLKGNRPRHRMHKLSMGKTSRKKSAHKAKLTYKSSAREKSSRKTSATKKLEAKQQKKSRAKGYERGSTALPRAPPTMSPEDQHQEVPVQQEKSPRITLPPVSTLLELDYNTMSPPRYRDPLQHPFTLWGPGTHMDLKHVTPRKETTR